MSFMDQQYFDAAKQNLEQLCREFTHNNISNALGVCVKNGAGDELFSYYGGSELPGGKGLQADENTLFNVASVSKIITSALMGMLLERGRLTLADPLKSYFPEFPYDDVTIYHLLTHTAGFTVTPDMGNPHNEQEKAALYKLIFAQERSRAAGVQMEYFSNYYILLGDIIEMLTGMGLNEFAQKELFMPLGMANTHYGAKGARQKQLINFYSNSKGRAMPELHIDLPLGHAGVISKASELVNLGQLIINRGTFNGRRLLASSTVDMLCRECTGGRFDRTPAFFTKGKTLNYSIIPDNASEKAVAHHGMTGCILFMDTENSICAAITGNTEKMHQPLHYRRLLSAVIPLSKKG